MIKLNNWGNKVKSENIIPRFSSRFSLGIPLSSSPAVGPWYIHGTRTHKRYLLLFSDQERGSQNRLFSCSLFLSQPATWTTRNLLPWDDGKGWRFRHETSTEGESFILGFLVSNGAKWLEEEVRERGGLRDWFVESPPVITFEPVEIWPTNRSNQ